MNTIITVLLNPLFWFVLLVVCYEPVELLPVIKAFRADQSKYNKLNISGHHVAKVVMVATLLGMVASGIMVAVTFAYHMSGRMLT